MKKIIQSLIVMSTLSLTQVSAHSSMGYDMLKDIVSMTMDNQNSIEMYRLFVNASLADVTDECSGTAVGTECEVHSEISFPVTAEMDALDTGGAFAIGDTITLTDGALTYTTFDTGKYDHSIKVKVDKIKINGTLIPHVSTEVFRWTDSGTDKAISFNGSDGTGTYREKFAMTTVSGKNTFIGNGTFETSGNKFIYNAKLQQYNLATNGIMVDMTTQFRSAAGISTFFSLLAKADDTGGLTKSTIESMGHVYEEEETFNATGVTTGYRWRMDGGAWSAVAIDATYAVDDSDIDGAVTVAIDSPAVPSNTSVPYLVVRHGVTPSESSIIGLGDFYDDNGDNTIQVSELHFDYFGDESYLADAGVSTDSDDLDIYDASDITAPTIVTGIYLTK